MILKQSTQVVVRIGPFVDVGDGFTPETGITLGAADEAELLKAGGGASVDISARTWAAVTGADGWYDLTLTTTDTNTIGGLTVVVQDDSVCLPVFMRFQVIGAVSYDSIFATDATDYLQVDVRQIVGVAVSTTTAQLGVNAVQAGATAWGSGAITAASIATGAITNAKFAAGAIDAAAIAANAIGASELASDAVAEIADAVWDEATSGHVTAGTTAVALTDILTDTAEIGAAGAGLTAIDLPDQTMNITGNLSGSVGSVTGAVGSVTGNVGGNVTGSVGSVLGAINTTGGTITTLDALDTAQDTQHGTTQAAIAALNDPTAGAIADAVWDEPRGDHNTQGTTGESHASVQSGTVDTGSFSATTTEFEADDITEATADHYIGRVIVFTSGVLRYQATDITDYALSGANGHFTVTALTEAPGNNDTFVVV